MLARGFIVRVCAGARAWSIPPGGLRAFAAAAGPLTQRGLLRGATDEYYSDELDLADAKALVEEAGMLWRAAAADVGSSDEGKVLEYLERVDSAKTEFMRSNELHDRVEVASALRTLFRREGQLVLALGGKSVGKSFLLNKLAEELNAEAARKVKLYVDANAKSSEAAELRKKATGGGTAEVLAACSTLEERAAALRAQADAIHPRRVIKYNARIHGADMRDGLMNVLREYEDSTFVARVDSALVVLLEAGAKLTAKTVATVAAVPPPAVEVLGGAAGEAGRAVGEGIRGLRGSKKQADLNDLLEAFIAACKDEGSFPCVVVDETNAALIAEDASEKKRTLEALRVLTSLTKEDQRINAFLASSEFAEPYRLSDLGFRSDHFTDTVVVPEVPPKDMHELLEGKWGMGANLATAFMAAWGGHVWAAAKGVDRLLLNKTRFKAVSNPIAFSADAKRGAAYCAQAQKRALAGMEGMDARLRSIALHGWVPFTKEDDPHVKLICERNVGGVVVDGAIAPGIPAAAWEGSPKTIVVATNQAMRVLLATELQR